MEMRESSTTADEWSKTVKLVGAGSNPCLNEELLLLDLVTTARKPLIPMLSGIEECIVLVLPQNLQQLFTLL